MPPTLVLGTRNRKKLQELQELLGDLPLRLLDLTSFPQAPEIVEDGTTFAENAAKKATGLATALGEWVLGEDSGLVVPALGGEPGVYSARYAGRQGDDEANNDLLLRRLTERPDADRSAYYVCTAAVSDPTGQVRATSEGQCHGRIIDRRRGTGGFGYDPLFLVPEYHSTFGELSARVKHALSHRGRAIARLRPALLALLRGEGPNVSPPPRPIMKGTIAGRGTH
jgi:XTP/dITP diphosphohydrolase